MRAQPVQHLTHCRRRAGAGRHTIDNRRAAHGSCNGTATSCSRTLTRASAACGRSATPAPRASIRHSGSMPCTWARMRSWPPARAACMRRCRCTGATGVFVLPALPYLVALGLPRETLMRALGYCFFTATLALATALAWHGAFARGALGPSLLALLPTAIGMWLGARLRQRISAEAFRRVFFLTLLALGMHQLWQALG